MPIARVQLPDGRIGRFEVPEGSTPEQVQSLIQAQLPALNQPATSQMPESLRPRTAIPDTRQDNSLYSRVRPFVAPTLEALGAGGGAILGGAAGTALGPLGATTGAVSGAGLGYGAAKELIELGDVYFGGKTPRQGITQITEPVGNVIQGATFEAGGRAVVPIIAKGVAKGVGKLADIRQIPNQLAAKTARESLASPEQIAAARNALRAAKDQNMTAQQALAAGGVVSPSAQATLEKAIKQTKFVDERAAIELAQEAARKSTIQNITPDLQAAINARRAASQPLYEASDRAIVPIDLELKQIISRMPINTISKARTIAKMEGRPFIMGKETPDQIINTGMLDSLGNPITKTIPGKKAEITGESLHYIKRALGDVAYGSPATTQSGRDTQLAARKLLDDYVELFERKVPEYGQARRIFSDLSAPVNQAQVLKEMVSVLEKPGGGERIGPFLNVLGRGEQAMLRRAGGRGAPRYESLSEVLTPEQLSVVKNVAKQLETQAAVDMQITAGQQRAADLIKDQLPNYRIPNIFNVLVTTANKVLGTLGVKVGKKTIDKLAEASLNANSFDELLATLPATERNKVLRALSDSSTWSAPTRGVITGTTAATVNMLAPEQTVENALVR